MGGGDEVSGWGGEGVGEEDGVEWLGRGRVVGGGGAGKGLVVGGLGVR